MNDIEKLVKKFPTEKWDWDALSENSAISFSFISRHMHLPWNFDSVSQQYNMELMMPTILTNLDKNWNWWWISNYKLPLHFIIKCMDYVNFDALSEHVPFEFIIVNRERAWDWHKISQRKEAILPKCVVDFPDLGGWNWDYLSLNPYINSFVVESTIDKPWNFANLSMNISIDWNFIIRHLDKPWDWKRLSFSIITTWDIISCTYSNPKFKWDWNLICLHNPNISYEIVINNPSFPWSYRTLSQNRMGHAFKMNDYAVLVADIVSLKIFSNDSLPTWLQLEILKNEYARFTEFEIFSLL